MSISVYENVLTDNEISYILNNNIVSENKDSLNNSENGKVYFSIELPDSIKNSLSSIIGLDLKNVTNVPMRWIKGNTPAHIDKGQDTFENTYLIYVTDSIGNLILDSKRYDIKKGTAFVFYEGLSHETIGTENTERLLIGPMSESGFGVGTITYNINYILDPPGTGTAPTQPDVAHGGAFTVASGSALTKTGYTFVGWLVGTTTYTPGQTYSNVRSNINLRSQWAINTYTVTYSVGTGSGTVPIQNPVSYGGTFTIASGSALTKTGYSFSGWLIGTTIYQPNETYSNMMSNVTLTAQWTINTYTVTYEAHGGTGDAPIQPDVEYDGTFIVAKNTFTNEGYVFNEWSDGTNSYQPEDIYTVTKDVTLNAVWTYTEYSRTSGIIFLDSGEDFGKVYGKSYYPENAVYSSSTGEIFHTSENGEALEVGFPSNLSYSYLWGFNVGSRVESARGARFEF